MRNHRARIIERWLLLFALLGGAAACGSSEAKKIDDKSVLEQAAPTDAPSADELSGGAAATDPASPAPDPAASGEPDGAAAAAAANTAADTKPQGQGSDDVDAGLDSKVQSAMRDADEGDVAGAIRKLEDMVELPRGGHLAAYNKAILHERLGQGDQAAKAYYKALQINPDFAPALINLVRLYLRQNRVQDASQLAEKQINARPRNSKLRTAKLDIMLAQGKYEDVSQQAKELLRQDERHVDAMVALAEANYRLGRYELARAVIVRAVDISPERAELYMRYGMIELKLNNKPGALANFKKAVELQPHYPEARNNLGVLYHEARDYQGAAEEFKWAARDNPGFKEAYLNLGNAYKGLRSFKDAEQAFRKAITLDERYADAYFNLGVLYLDSPVPDMEPVARLNKAIETLNKYKEVAGGRIAKGDPVDKYIAEAKKAIETEKAKQELMRQNQMQGGEENNGAQPAPES